MITGAARHQFYLEVTALALDFGPSTNCGHMLVHIAHKREGVQMNATTFANVRAVFLGDPPRDASPGHPQ